MKSYIHLSPSTSDIFFTEKTLNGELGHHRNLLTVISEIHTCTPTKPECCCHVIAASCHKPIEVAVPSHAMLSHSVVYSHPGDS
jgi:hypothetical protein